jgi:thioredoxin-like negative regulator of GroEL
VQPLQTGAIYRTGDVDRIAELITEFAKHPAELARMGASAQLWIKQHSVQAAVDRLLECLTAIIEI